MSRRPAWTGWGWPIAFVGAMIALRAFVLPEPKPATCEGPFCRAPGVNIASSEAPSAPRGPIVP